MEAILNHYEQAHSDTFHGNFVQPEPNVNPTRAKAEWDDFKILFLKRKDYEHHIHIEIKAVKNPTSEEGKKGIDRIHKARKMFTPQLLWKNSNNDDTAKCLYPSMMFFLYILQLFPISVACVERLFSKMKLIKTRLQNELSQVHSDQLLRIAIESPKKSFSDSTYEEFVNEIKKKNPKLITYI